MNDLSTQASQNSPSTRKDAANYMGLFPDSQTRCAPGALQANNGRLAYLVYLKSLVEAFEARADVAPAITLQERRPDLLQLKLDDKTSKRSLPTLRVVLGVLESRAREVLKGPKTLQQAVAEGVCHGNVPFNAPWEAIKATLAVKQLSLWDVTGSCTTDSPAFTFDNLTLPGLREAITLSNGFSPQLSTLLLAKRESDAAFYQRHFHTRLEARSTLSTAQGLCKALGITRKHLRQLLAVQAIGKDQTAVTRSANVTTATVAAASSKVYGASVINNSGAPLYLTRPDPVGKTVHITGMTTSHLDRLQRMLRLQRALELEADETDSVVMAALRAEGLQPDYTLSAATLRALGLFRHLQQHYGATAAQFAAFIHEISPYSSNRTPAFFDRLFNPDSSDEDTAPTPPLVLDGSAFDPAATEGADAQTMKLLCLGLKVDEPLLRGILEQVVKAQQLSQPTRSLAVISACYRMTALPRLFGIDAQSGVLALGLLSRQTPAYVRQLAGVPSLASASAEADIVDVIVGFMDTLLWLKREALNVQQLVFILQNDSPIANTEWNIAFTEDFNKATDTPDEVVHAALRKALTLESDNQLADLLRWANLKPDALLARMQALDQESNEKSKAPLQCFTPTDLLEWTKLERYSALIKLFKLSAGAVDALVNQPACFDLQGTSATTLRPLDLTTVYQLSRYKALLARLPMERSESDVLSYLQNAVKQGEVSAAQSANAAWATVEKLLNQPTDRLARLSTLTPPTTLCALDRLMRLLDLAQQHRLSVDALVGLGELRQTRDDAAFERFATALRQGCSSPQRKALDAQLRMAWRDALVAWMLVHWAPADAKRSWVNSPQTLADYLLLDLQVAHQPLTTRLLSATASLQRYLHQIHSRLENGYRNTAISEHERDEWVDFASHYERWKLREDVRNEPQNFIDPTRRERKTTAFKELETQLAQGKCRPEDIQTAMLGYLSSFEKVSNIQPISAYADGTSPLEDTYHFIGKTNVEPVEYYWRTLDLKQRDQHNAPSMLAWGEWEKISLPLAGNLVLTTLPKTAPLQYREKPDTPEADKAAEAQKKSDAEKEKQAEDARLAEDLRTHIELIRPVIIAGRRYVVWAEWEATAIAMGPENKQSPYFPLRVCFAFQQTDGAWSAPNELIRLDGHDEQGVFDPNLSVETPVNGSTPSNAFLKTKDFVPGLAVMLNNMGGRLNDPWLTVLLFDGSSSTIPTLEKIPEWKTENKYFIVNRDLLLLENKALDAKSEPDIPIESRLVQNWLFFFSDPRVVQHPYVGPMAAIEDTGTPTHEMRDFDVVGCFGINEFININRLIPPFKKRVSANQKEIEIKIPNSLTISRSWTSHPSHVIHHQVYGLLAYCKVGLIEHAETFQITVDMIVASEKINNFSDLDVFSLNVSVDEFRLGQAITLRSESLEIKYDKGEKNYNAKLERTLSHLSFDGIYSDEVLFKNPQLDEKAKLSLLPFEQSDIRLPVTFTVDNSVSENVAWLLSAHEKKLLEDFNLIDLIGYAKSPGSGFAALKKLIFKERYITEYTLANILGSSCYQGPKGIISIENAVIRARAENNTTAINALLEVEVESIAGDLEYEVPSGILISSIVRLWHHHPEESRRIFLCIDPQHKVEFYCTFSADGEGYLTFRHPINRDAPEYVVTLTIIDEATHKNIIRISQSYRLTDLPDDLVPSVRVRRNNEQALYLDFDEVNSKSGGEPVPHQRLNTLFGKQLVALATQSVERALSWEAQCLPEPRLAAGTSDTTVDFRSANGLYFWELFFHAPMLVAWQLRQNREYREAWRWCTRHLFDPYRTWKSEGNQAPLYWMTQPIIGRSAYAPSNEVNDPDLLAYAAPVRYRMALHLFVVESWQRQGDDLYRQLTRDTLVEAAICYDRALRLIGTLPENLSSTPREALTLAQAQRGDFTPPLNNKLIELRNLLRSRLFNLRHGLTLDGKPATLMLNPDTLDQALLGFGAAAVEDSQVARVARPVPPCRYEEVRKRADAAVLQLIELGQTLLRFYDTEGAQKLALFSKANYIKLLDFPCRLQEQALESAKRGRDTLLASKQMVQHRLGYYQALVEEGITPIEEMAIAMGYGAQAYYAMSIPFQMLAGATDMLPQVFGMAFGGSEPAGFPEALASGALTMGKALEMTSEELRQQAGYQLRAQEWQFQADQATLELNMLDKQLLEQDVHIRAAKLAMEEVRAKQAAQRAEYEVMTTVFSSHATYLWLIGRMSDIYSTAYDATLSLCLMAETCLQYELGDFNSTWIKPGAWIDNWRGMLAGEALERDLIEMDTAAVVNNERPLDIRMELSLTALLGGDGTTLQNQLENGVIHFDLRAKLFDEQYPGHYLRRIERITLTFIGKDKGGVLKTLTGPISAMLTQTSNIVLLSNDIEGAKHLYSPKDGTAQNLLRDLRPNQQAAVWYSKPVTRNLDLQPSIKDPTRYLPFEGTGAISSWVLSFPAGAKSCSTLYSDGKCVVEDIHIELSYSALDGGEAFADGIRALLDKPQSTSETPDKRPPEKQPTVDNALTEAKANASSAVKTAITRTEQYRKAAEEAATTQALQSPEAASEATKADTAVTDARKAENEAALALKEIAKIKTVDEANALIDKVTAATRSASDAADKARAAAELARHRSNAMTVAKEALSATAKARTTVESVAAQEALKRPKAAAEAEKVSTALAAARKAEKDANQTLIRAANLNTTEDATKVIDDAREAQEKGKKAAQDAEDAAKAAQALANRITLADVLADIGKCDDYAKVQVQIASIVEQQGAAEDPQVVQALRHAYVYALVWAVQCAGDDASKLAEAALSAVITDAEAGAEKRQARIEAAKSSLDPLSGDERIAATRAYDDVRDECRRDAVADASAAEDAFHAAQQNSSIASNLSHAVAQYENTDVRKTRDLAIAKAYLNKQLKVRIDNIAYEGVVAKIEEQLWAFRLNDSQGKFVRNVICGIDLHIEADPIRLNTLTPNLESVNLQE
ncbi:neuraminidase-like domain-containing protein [Pseudomonas sp. H9]|uniref:Tc toxin subunit A-related protein n=1 Tax=Pseudomonas sp. H9 TaxID=483968 RepID=UPI001057CFD7|nr:neuraminidase-like domain-containing protein [Pseudomonas sp. H9]TDF83900.1 hypothetical protein E1573_09110 [Pseudomonas sp. H9]